MNTSPNGQDMLASFHRGDLLEIEGLTDNAQFAPIVQVQPRVERAHQSRGPIGAGRRD